MFSSPDHHALRSQQSRHGRQHENGAVNADLVRSAPWCCQVFMCQYAVHRRVSRKLAWSCFCRAWKVRICGWTGYLSAQVSFTYMTISSQLYWRYENHGLHPSVAAHSLTFASDRSNGIAAQPLGYDIHVPQGSQLDSMY